MLIKTNSLPPALAPLCERIHRFLLDPPSVEWQLVFRAGSGTQLAPVLTVAAPEPADQYASKVESIVYPTRLGQRILDRQLPLDLGGMARVRLPDLSRVRFDQSSIVNGYLTLPPLSVELPGLPDPTAVGLLAERNSRSFLLHLQGRVSGAPLEVRLTF